jgi:hypothetical protein
MAMIRAARAKIAAINTSAHKRNETRVKNIIPNAASQYQESPVWPIKIEILRAKPGVSATRNLLDSIWSRFSKRFRFDLAGKSRGILTDENGIRAPIHMGPEGHKV